MHTVGEHANKHACEILIQYSHAFSRYTVSKLYTPLDNYSEKTEFDNVSRITLEPLGRSSRNFAQTFQRYSSAFMQNFIALRCLDAALSNFNRTFYAIFMRKNKLRSVDPKPLVRFCRNFAQHPSIMFRTCNTNFVAIPRTSSKINDF